MASLLDTLTELDTATGLAYADNDEELYTEVLVMFYTQLTGEFHDLASKLTHSDDVIIRQVHTLKGSAGSVGAERVAATAATIESALKRHMAITNEQVSELECAIHAAAAQLAPFADEAAG